MKRRLRQLARSSKALLLAARASRSCTFTHCLLMPLVVTLRYGHQLQVTPSSTGVEGIGGSWGSGSRTSSGVASVDGLFYAIRGEGEVKKVICLTGNHVLNVSHQDTSVVVYIDRIRPHLWIGQWQKCAARTGSKEPVYGLARLQQESRLQFEAFSAAVVEPSPQIPNHLHVPQSRCVHRNLAGAYCSR